MGQKRLGMFAKLLKLNSSPLTAKHYTEYGAIRTLLLLNDTHAFQRYLQTLI